MWMPARKQESFSWRFSNLPPFEPPFRKRNGGFSCGLQGRSCYWKRASQLRGRSLSGIIVAVGEWRSLVAHRYGVPVVAGSNPVSPISSCTPPLCGLTRRICVKLWRLICRKVSLHRTGPGWDLSGAVLSSGESKWSA